MVANNSQPHIQSPAVSTMVLTEETDFNSIHEEWDSLVDASFQRACFLRCEWNRAWWRSFATRENQLFMITCRDERDRLVGLAPFYLKPTDSTDLSNARQVCFLGTNLGVIGLSDRDIIVRSGYESSVALAVVERLRQSSQWDDLWLDGIPAASTVLPHLRLALHHRAQVIARNPIAYIDATIDWETFSRTLSRAVRKSINRSTRRLFALYECEFRCVETEDELAVALTALMSLHRARWKSQPVPDTLNIPHIEEFLRHMAQRSLPGNRLRLWTLALDGRIVAAEMAFFDAGVIYHVQTGFDPDYAKESVGTVLLMMCIKDSIERETVREIIIGKHAGYKKHWTKTSWGTVQLTLRRSDWSSPT